jgi:hypothetical protein
MFRSLWVWVVVGAVVVAVLGSLRWALADFLLDEFGSLTDSLRGEHPEGERFASGRSDVLQSSSKPEVIQP